MSSHEYKTKLDIRPVEKIYWFLRMFIATKYANPHNDPKILDTLNHTIGSIVSVRKSYGDDEATLGILKSSIEKVICPEVKKVTKKSEQRLDLFADLLQLLTSVEDYLALQYAVDQLLIPSNQALERVPTTQATEIAEIYAKSVLEEQGTSGLANLLIEWDELTLDICLNREREICSKLFQETRRSLKSNRPVFLKVSEKEEDILDSDIVLSGLIQEFERRLGQKRKQRSGNDLEGATSFIFKYYGLKGAEEPKHFTADIEVDNWLMTKSKWYLGFSLKRTLRERWKQTVVDKDTLTTFKVRNIIHLICEDGDLTTNKLADMVAKRHLFFVPDNSRVLDNVKDDVVLRDAIMPMSHLVEYLKKEIEK